MSIQASNETGGHVLVFPPPEVPIAGDVLQAAQRLGIAGQLPQVIAISRELFGDRIRLRVAEDSELEGWTHIVIETPVGETAEAVAAKEGTWCDQMVDRGLSHWFNLSTYYLE